jgi:hypothetical protein
MNFHSSRPIVHYKYDNYYIIDGRTSMVRECLNTRSLLCTSKITAHYQMTSRLTFLQLAVSRGVVINAIKVSLVVGSILAVINHGSAILALDISLRTCIKILLSYIVPYCVASYSAVRALQRIRLEN